MYQYTICNQPDEEIFNRQCKALEQHIPDLTLVQDMRDVDGSLIRIYSKENATIKVKNDHYVGGVFIDSDIELTSYFQQ